MIEKLDYYKELVADDIRLDKENSKTFQKIEDMWNNKWELPVGLKDKQYMRSFKTTAPHDAILAAGRVMANKLPTIKVQPMSPSSENGTEERIETLLDWHFYNILRRSPSNPFMDIAMSAVKFSRIAFQVIHIPTELSGNSKAIQATKRLGDFSWRVHKNPQNVHARFDDFILRSVSVASTRTASEIINLYPGIKVKLESEVRKRISDQDSLGAALSRMKFTLYDCMDYDNRAIWLSLQEGGVVDETGGGSDSLEIMRKEHGLPFLPWVYKQDDHPLMKSVVDADLYSNANVLESLRYYLVIATVAQARSWSKTISGDGVEIDHTEPASQVQLKTGEEFGMLPPAQLDPTINMLIDSVRGDIRQTTVAEALTTIDKLASGTPFATVNAILQASIASLGTIQKITENSLEEGFYQMLQWMDHTGKPLVGKRRVTKNTNMELTKSGADIVLKKGDISPEDIFITVSLNTTTPTDKDSAINRAILMSSRLPISPRKALEDNGVEYTDADEQSFMTYQYSNAEMQADLKSITMRPELEAQQMQMQQQQAMQQEQMQAQAQTQMAEQPQVEQPMTENMQGEAGLPPSSVPTMTRESMSNQDMSGQGIA